MAWNEIVFVRISTTSRLERKRHPVQFKGEGAEGWGRGMFTAIFYCQFGAARYVHLRGRFRMPKLTVPNESLAIVYNKVKRT